MTENTHAGRLIVLTGPTAVGKGTVEAKLRAVGADIERIR